MALQGLKPLLKRKRPVILEIGSSNPHFLRFLRQEAPHAELVASDFISGPLLPLSEKLPGIPVVQMDITQCPFFDETFDAVVCLNVLEHIKDDGKALLEIARILRPGGIAILEVPAGEHLFDFYDAHLMHFRRYNMRKLNQLLKSSGLTVRRSTHLGFSVYPAFAFSKRRNQKSAPSPDEVESLVKAQIAQTRSSYLMRFVLRLETLIGRFLSYPRGIRCSVIAVKGS